MAAKRAAPADKPETSSLAGQYANIAANPGQLTPGTRTNRGNALNQLLEAEEESSVSSPAPKSRRRGEDGKSPYRRFVSEEAEHGGKKGHFCLVSVTSEHHRHGNTTHPQFLATIDISNIKSHFETWHKKVSVKKSDYSDGRTDQG